MAAVVLPEKCLGCFSMLGLKVSLFQLTLLSCIACYSRAQMIEYFSCPRKDAHTACIGVLNVLTVFIGWKYFSDSVVRTQMRFNIWSVQICNWQQLLGPDAFVVLYTKSRCLAALVGPRCFGASC